MSFFEENKCFDKFCWVKYLKTTPASFRQNLLEHAILNNAQLSRTKFVLVYMTYGVARRESKCLPDMFDIKLYGF